ncbi:hypothetical protein B0H17DRAFT_1205961 [Mycena rosella]|uniref:Uncharacterized protein n=1 Tax=Mycena rosella TaxID=1033263 RepID=A0AAD7GC55_MYCRO|nr:hypothetical protein B0H17DRAFT_1205961 [Mycena rosella]
MSSYHHQLASPWLEDLQIERLILGIVPEDVRKVGGIPLKNCLHNLFETALELRLKEWRAGEDAQHQQELEAEHVWGYVIGWRLCSEVLQAHAQASTNPPSTTPCSLSVATTLVVVASPTPAHLDWAQDAEALPVSPRKPEFSPFPPPCNFSALCTSAVIFVHADFGPSPTSDL